VRAPCPNAISARDNPRNNGVSGKALWRNRHMTKWESELMKYLSRCRGLEIKSTYRRAGDDTRIIVAPFSPLN